MYSTKHANDKRRNTANQNQIEEFKSQENAKP